MWYSYATVRVVPRVERGEFLNVGVIVFAREQGFLAGRVEVDAARLLALAPDLDVGPVDRHLRTMLSVCAGEADGGPVAALPAAERFHWLVAPRSTVIQMSPVHVGRADDPALALEELMAELVRPASAAPGAGPAYRPDYEGAGA